MFNFFKKRAVENNTTEALEAVASFLIDDTPTDSPLPHREFLQTEKLDYSLDSLKYVDEYLSKFRAERGSFNDNDQDIITVALRCGAYTGEVMRRSGKKEFTWLTFDQAVKKCGFPKEWSGLSTVYVLNYGESGVMMPIGKVLKFLDNGEEDSLYFFAQLGLLPEQK